MKRTLLLALFSITSLQTHASCPDLSGVYASPFDTPEMQTTFIINQNKCDSLHVAQTLLNPGVNQTAVLFILDGSPAKSCLMDWFAGCGSMKATSDAIEKSDPSNRGTIDDEHGYCRFTSSLLSKDSKGNLLETIRDATCEDGYRGALVQPLVYPKK